MKSYVNQKALHLLRPDKQQKVIDLYFSESSLGFNFCRTHINSSDYGVMERARESMSVIKI